MSTKANSAIDVIYLLNEKLSNIETKLDLIDNNIKDLNNKVYVLNSRVAKMSQQQLKPTVSSAQNTTQEESGLILGNVKVHGYIVNSSKKPVPNVSVGIFQNEAKIRNLFTDKNGYWEAKLPGGTYRVIYEHEKFKPIEKVISFDNNQKSYEVR